MLLELRVENYAVIDSLAVEFDRGLNLLTGETGAGKSILIDALALLLGNKAFAESIRHGAEKAVVSGVFEADHAALKSLLEANGLESGEGQADTGHIIVKREVAAGGKGRVFINNQPATVAMLRQLAPFLASVHAQNENLLAFDATARLGLLDSYAGINLEELEARYREWASIGRRMAELERDEKDRLRMVDLWSFQKKEIEAAQLLPGEDQKLETEKRVLGSAEKLHAAALAVYDLLYDSENSVEANLAAARRHLEELERFDPKFQESLTALQSARVAVEDVSATVRDYAQGIDASPERLAQVEDRLAVFDKLKRKYGARVDDVIAYGEEVARKLNEVENREEVVAGLKKQLEAAAEAYLAVARAVSKKRHTSARELQKLVEAEINQLAMKSQFKIEVTGAETSSSWTASGFDTVAYLISTNAGEPLKPVELIASGGELSRVMLALKATIETGRKSKSNLQKTLVFDEVDAGIGGRAAEAVGKKLKMLARTCQVLCITHLPQIASFADHHFLIEKREAGGRTSTSVRLLNNGERTEEVARMLSGAHLTESSRQHAEQLLKTNA
ncbi:MAG TPA: DNA repair protein RecN [Candidatus Saccharimonadales bacterium]|nr:DNA repair protein RecN [Candidatus Saccharimonadales bacterium]